ncbi:hypothetical protein [Streptomyces echinatus]|uniref:hypothetical protein n=1 Tax=Streptomyces echinatus TaxID=67293 RepID=UPI0016077C76|nr:hypothetical protein [Streptomyces echinatus]
MACFTGALLGAVHGAEALPVDLVSRHELGWVTPLPSARDSCTNTGTRRWMPRVISASRRLLNAGQVPVLGFIRRM